MSSKLGTHIHGDADRLPHGMKRVAYDADRTQYLYRDQNAGKTYVGRPGEEYGVMVSESEAENVGSRGLGRKPTLPAYKRPVRFADDTSGESSSEEHTDRPPTHPYGHTKSVSQPAYSQPAYPQPDASHHAHYGTGMTFADILPSNLLASAPPMDPPKSSKRASITRHKPSASDPGARGRLPRGEKEEYRERERPGSPTKKTFQGAARMVGRAAMAFGKKEKREEKEDWGAYQRVD